MFLFIHINKCGGTSMRSALESIDSVEVAQNNGLVEMPSYKWDNYNTFTIVRNPIDRIQSLQAMLEKIHGYSISINSILDLVEDESIDYRSMLMSTPTPEYIKRHALPMTHKHYNVYRDNKINVNRWWKLEELDQIKPEIEEWVGSTIEIPVLNKTTKNKAKLKKQEIERIRSVYSKDFEVFYK